MTHPMMNVSVILPAAGTGSRFGGPTNKIFQPLAGKEMFLWTLSRFAGRADVCQILLVVSPSDAEIIARRYGAALAAMKVGCVEGGPTRSDSVRNALARLTDQAQFVCVHDAVRPCVGGRQIDAVFAQAAQTGAAILAEPVVPTIKEVEPSGRILRTVPRQALWAAQTPQVFRRDWLVDAYASGEQATDDAELVQARGHAVFVVPGEPSNIKVTTPGDLAMAEALLAGHAAGRGSC
ncbi:MAG: 2-C-methyl-D-erythritol 4-phosphate cytidylyltransferase [Planctomycetota bacterium]